LDRLDEAELNLRAALDADPQVAATLNELGLVLRRKGELQGAEECFRGALALDEDNAIALSNLALVLSAMNRHEEAASLARSVRRGFEGQPITDANIGILDSAANALDAAGHTAEAIEIYKTAFNLRPDPLRAIWAIYAARRACDWEFAALLEPQACRVSEAGVAIDESAPWRLLSLSKAGPAEQLAAARKCAAQISATSPAVRPARNAEIARERLRIGYFSGDFYSHPVPHLMTGVIEAHDRSRFEVAAYDVSPPTRDEYRTRLERAFDRMVAVGDLPTAAAARKIADDAVDIIVDLTGWTRRARAAVLAARPASLQVQWLGYPGTLGAPWIDYIVADRVLIPEDDEIHYAEKVIRLPDSYQANDDKRRATQTLGRSDYGLPDNGFVFCSFNAGFKVTPEIFEIWLDLLRAVDRSVLWLLQPEDVAVQALREKAAAAGIDAGRIVFAPMVPPVEHLARAVLADLALDCFPYGSHTTASDMLWAGVPMVALAGQTFASRVSASVLNAAGLPHLTTHTLEDYYGLVLHLACNPSELASIRKQVKDLRGTAPLFNTARFTRKLESAFEVIWDRHRRGLAPDHVNID
jgi:predicted O-linked N-acetylglucosamine transferase (SPINDLY family)